MLNRTKQQLIQAESASQLAARLEDEHKEGRPEGQDVSLGSLTQVAMRGTLHTHISRSGYGLLHDRDRARDAAVGSPALKHGDLYHFAFAVFGGGSGVVVGVIDATAAEGDELDDRAAAWGLNLSHGALYTKASGRDKGELHSQQIVPLPALDRCPEHHL